MEAKIIDFKNPIKPSTNNLSKNEPWKKSKDFSSTLDSINDKNGIQKQNNKTLNKSNEKDLDDVKKTNIVSNKTSDTKENELDLDKIDEIEDEVSSDNAVIILQSLFTIKDISVKEEETGLSTEVDLELIDKLNLNNNISEEPVLKSVDGENIIKLEENPDKTFGLNIDKKDIQLNSLKKDEISGSLNLLNKTDSLNNENTSIEEVELSPDQVTKNGIRNIQNLNQENNSKGSSEGNEEVLVASQVEEDNEINNKPFVFLERDGIKFVGDKVIKPEQPVTVNKDNIIEQIVDKVKVNFSDIKNEIKLSLKPEVLGELTMNIEVIKGEVIAKVMVESQRTKEVIESNLIQLKEGIKDTGLEIKTFEVFVGSGSDFDKHNSGQFNLNKNNQKTKIKVQDNKSIKNYEEGSIDNKINSIGLYSENGLNLFA